MLNKFFDFFAIFLVLWLTTGSVHAAAPIKIGGLFSVTGPASFLGEPERNTAQMVVDEINKAGGIKGRTTAAYCLRYSGRRNQGSSGCYEVDQGRQGCGYHRPQHHRRHHGGDTPC